MNNKAGDGVFRYRDGIAVAQVVFFSAAVLAALRFRWTRRIGWFCIGVLSIFRLVSASCMLQTIHHDTDNYWAAIFVCESLGVLLIIFLLLEMLERMYVWELPQFFSSTFSVPTVLLSPCFKNNNHLTHLQHT